MKRLEKKKIKTLKIEKELKENIKYISKPEFGTGSTNIIIFKKKIKIKHLKKNVIQKYYQGKKGVLLCLCYKKVLRLFVVMNNY